MTHILLALALTTAQLSDLKQSLEYQFYHKLTPIEQQLIRDTTTAFTYRIFRAGGSQVMEQTDEEAAILREVEYACDQKMMDSVWNGLVVEMRPLADARVRCVNDEFTSRRLPYSATLLEQASNGSN